MLVNQTPRIRSSKVNKLQVFTGFSNMVRRRIHKMSMTKTVLQYSEDKTIAFDQREIVKLGSGNSNTSYHRNYYYERGGFGKYRSREEVLDHIDKLIRMLIREEEITVVGARDVREKRNQKLYGCYLMVTEGQG